MSGPEVCRMLVLSGFLIQCETQGCVHCQNGLSRPVTTATSPGLSGTIPIFMIKVPFPRKLLVLGKMKHLVTCPDHGKQSIMQLPWP